MSDLLKLAVSQLLAPNWWHAHPATDTRQTRTKTFATSAAKERIRAIKSFLTAGSKKATAEAVANHLSCDKTNAADYLNHLYDLGELERGKNPDNGRQYIYWIEE